MNLALVTNPSTPGATPIVVTTPEGELLYGPPGAYSLSTMEDVYSVGSLTPENIVSQLPDIAEAVAPLPIPQAASLWCDVNAWVSDNPVTAILLLFGLVDVLWRKKR